jgi:hypothetical protein
MVKRKSPCRIQLWGIYFFVFLFFSCSPYRQFIRVDPHLADYKNTIDTIAVFSDALAAVDEKIDYYSANSSYLLDTLILSGAQESLRGKGYVTKQIDPIFFGSFMDSFLYVPVKKFNIEPIEQIRLPGVFRNELPESRLKAFARTCRRLYLNTVFNNSNQISFKMSNPIIKADLDTLQNIIRCDYALFIFHQAVLIDPDFTFDMALGTAAVTTFLSRGKYTASYTYLSSYHTYIVLLQLSTGKLVWSNYTLFDAAPIDPVFQIRKEHITSLAGYLKPDIMENVLWRWKEFNLEVFPEKNDSKMFPGRKKCTYPWQNPFQGVPPDFDSLFNFKLKKRIDSAIIAFSISEDPLPDIPRDSINYKLGKGRAIENLQPTLDAVARYLEYAYFCRLRFKPTLKGEVTIRFVVLADGSARKIELLNSTLNDRILEYELAKIILNVDFGASDKTNGNTLIKRKLVCDPSKLKRQLTINIGPFPIHLKINK